MTPHFLAGMKPELLLTAHRGSLLVFGHGRNGIIGDHWVKYRTGSVHFCHRDYKTQETALVAQVAWQ